MRYRVLAVTASLLLFVTASMAQTEKKVDKKVDAKTAEKVEYGQYLSGSCVTCHQLSGAANGIPAIVGWDAEDFVEVLTSYKTKERENKAMQTVVATMAKDEMEALGAYFATIEPKDE